MPSVCLSKLSAASGVNAPQSCSESGRVEGGTEACSSWTGKNATSNRFPTKEDGTGRTMRLPRGVTVCVSAGAMFMKNLVEDGVMVFPLERNVKERGALRHGIPNSYFP